MTTTITPPQSKEAGNGLPNHKSHKLLGVCIAAVLILAIAVGTAVLLSSTGSKSTATPTTCPIMPPEDATAGGRAVTEGLIQARATGMTNHLLGCLELVWGKGGAATKEAASAEKFTNMRLISYTGPEFASDGMTVLFTVTWDGGQSNMSAVIGRIDGKWQFTSLGDV